MNRFLLFLFTIITTGLANQNTSPLFEIDLRIRVVNNDLLYIVVQIDNHSSRTVTELEGYITELDPYNRVISEHKIIHVHDYDPMFRDGQTVVRGVTYQYDPTNDYRYQYHINHVKFRNDPRIFLYSKYEGLIRLE